MKNSGALGGLSNGRKTKRVGARSSSFTTCCYAAAVSRVFNPASTAPCPVDSDPNNCFRDPRARAYAAQTAEAVVGLEFHIGH